MKKYHLAAGVLAGIIAACTQPNAPANVLRAPETGTSFQAQATVPVGKGPHGIAFCQGYVYVANTSGNSLTVLDANTNTKVKDFPIPGKPSHTLASPDRTMVINVDTTGKVRVIDPTKQEIVQTLDVAGNPDKVCFLGDSRTVAITTTNASNLVVLRFAADIKQAPTVSNMTVGTVAGTGSKHRGISFYGGQMLVPNTGENNVSLLDAANGKSQTLTAGNDPGVVALAGDAADPVAVIGNASSNTVTVTKLKSGESKTFAGGTTPTDAGARHDGKYVFISNAGSNDLSVIDPVAMSEVARVPVGKRPVHVYTVGADGFTTHSDAGHGPEQVWVMNDDGDSVTVLDGDTFKVLATVAVGKGHHKAAFSATKAYITNITSNDVSVIDRAAVH